VSDLGQIILLAWLFIAYFVTCVAVHHHKLRAAKREAIQATKPTVAQLEAEAFAPISDLVKLGETRAEEEHRLASGDGH
jgi:hypothetical protein